MKVRIDSLDELAPAKLIVGVRTIAIYDDDDTPLALFVKLPDNGIICYDDETGDGELAIAMKMLGINKEKLEAIPVTKV